MKDKDELSFQKFLDFIKEKDSEKLEKEKPHKKEKSKRKVKEIERKDIEKIEEREIAPLSEELKPSDLIEVEAVLEEEMEEYLIFKVSDESYAVYTYQATEVVTGLEIIETLDLPDYALGMTNFRNLMVPVLSFSKLLCIDMEREPYSFLFIEKEKKEHFFIRIGQVRGIFKKRDVKLLEVPFNLDKEIVRKIILIDKELIPLIDINKLIEKRK
ncbi:MAG: chemotaxis protein CheW [Candidatus Hydrothermales bacterium]